MELKENFVLGRGTCLSAFYLAHRKSEDLDFFEKNISYSFKEIENILSKRFKNFKAHRTLDRKIFFINNCKVEFVPNYFKRINSPIKNKNFNIFIESIEDVAGSKIIAITDRFDIKDYIDIYFICKEKKWDVVKLIKLAEKKCELYYEYLINLKKFSQISSFEGIYLRKEVELSKIKEFFNYQQSLIEEEGANKLCEKLDNYKV